MNKISFIVLVVLLCTACNEAPYDVIITGAKILDGSVSDTFDSDVGIRADKIAKIGRLSGKEATLIIDGEGLIIAPGFIDLHTHLDPILDLSDCESHIRQGVTTALGGPDGGGPWPVGQYLKELEQLGTGLNVGYMVGHNVVRGNVMGMENRAPTIGELDSMKAQVQTAMVEGAFGLSTGLKYLPGTFATVEEVIELSLVASTYGGFYTSHLREEGLGLLDGVAEAIRIAKEGEIPVILTHHKVVGQPMWGSSVQTLEMVDQARASGLDVMIDQYPYTASYTGIGILIPGWAMSREGNVGFASRVADPVLRDSIKNGIIFNLINDRGGNDLRRVQFAKVDWKPELEGQTLHDWAMMEGLDPTIENGAELIIRAQLNRGASCVFHAMHEEDVERIMKHPQTMIASDGRLVKPGQGHPHPRWYGTFPRVLGHYSRELGILDLALAVHKMTGMPADRMGLHDRGYIREGYFADLVIFDAKKVIDKATFEDPHQYPEGIPYVIINGQLAVDDGTFTGNKNGVVLKGAGYKKNLP